jgi:hypothetical protein
VLALIHTVWPQGGRRVRGTPNRRAAGAAAASVSTRPVAGAVSGGRLHRDHRQGQRSRRYLWSNGWYLHSLRNNSYRTRANKKAATPVAARSNGYGQATARDDRAIERGRANERGARTRGISRTAMTVARSVAKLRAQSLQDSRCRSTSARSACSSPVDIAQQRLYALVFIHSSQCPAILYRLALTV